VAIGENEATGVTWEGISGERDLTRTEGKIREQKSKGGAIRSIISPWKFRDLNNNRKARK